MLNTVAKFLLVASSLAPVLGAIATIKLASREPWCNYVSWLGAALLLVVLCWGMLFYAAKNAQKHQLRIAQFERSDQEILAFLLAYLLPFVATGSIAFTKGWLVGAYILGIICLVIAHVGAFHFNPVMWLLGYHFYSVRDPDGMSHVLISRRRLTSAGVTIQTVQLAHHIYLHTEV